MRMFNTVPRVFHRILFSNFNLLACLVVFAVLLWQTSEDKNNIYSILILLNLAFLFGFYTYLPQYIQFFTILSLGILQIEVLTNKIKYLEKFGVAASSLLMLILILSAKVQKSTSEWIQTYLSSSNFVYLVAMINLIIGIQSNKKWVVVIICCILFDIRAKKFFFFTKFDENQMLNFISLSGICYCVITAIIQNPISLLKGAQSGSLNYINSELANPGRLVGLSGDYEMLAIYLTFLLIIVMRNFVYYSSRSRVSVKILHLISVIFISICLMSTGSLTYVFISLLALAWLIKDSTRSKNLGLLVLSVPITIAIIYIAKIVISGRALARGILLSNLQSYDAGQLTNRIPVWKAVLNNRTWSPNSLVGTGLPFPIESIGTWPHNSYISFWIVGGLLVLATLILFYGLYLWNVLLNIRRVPQWVLQLNILLFFAMFTTDVLRSPQILILSIFIFRLTQSKIMIHRIDSSQNA